MARLTHKEQLKLTRSIGPISSEMAIYNRLGDYEDAEEQGLLLRLPCKVGDTIWCIVSASTKIVECTVLWIEWHRNGVIVFSLDGGLGEVVLAHLGKVWFLTEAEAEQTLAEMKGV